MSLNLTISEIRHLAEFAGISVDVAGMEDEMDTIVVIMPCPEAGIANEDGSVQKYNGHCAYFYDIPEEGCMPLGEPIDDAPIDAGPQPR